MQKLHNTQAMTYMLSQPFKWSRSIIIIGWFYKIAYRINNHRKMKIRDTFLLAAIISVIGCTEEPNNVISSQKYNELLKETIFPIADSLLNKEQLKLRIKLNDILYTYMYIEENCQKLSITKEYFEQQGIPPHYYDVLKYQMHETNECIERWIAEDDILAPYLKQDSLYKQFEKAKEKYWNIERPKLINKLILLSGKNY